jgi:hypothetical protein
MQAAFALHREIVTTLVDCRRHLCDGASDVVRELAGGAIGNTLQSFHSWHHGYSSQNKGNEDLAPYLVCTAISGIYPASAARSTWHIMTAHVLQLIKGDRSQTIHREVLALT